MAGRDPGHAGALSSDAMKHRLVLLLALAACAALPGCAVVSVASTAVSVGAGAVGLAADAAIGTVRITGKAVGAAADAVLPGSSD
jgi:hypothetical protein